MNLKTFLRMMFAFIITICFITVTEAISEETPPATGSIAEIYQKATERQKQIRNLKVGYTLTYKQTLALPKYPLGSMGGTRKFEVAFMGDKRLLRKDFQDSNPSNNVKSVELYTGNEWFEYKTGILKTLGSKKQNMEGSDVYCRFILQIPLSDADQAQYDNAWFYPHVLRAIGDKSKYQLLPNQEKIDDAWCLVVEYPGADKIWIDPNLDYMIRRRDRFEPIEMDKDSVPLYSYHLRDFKKISGIWIPMSCTVENYVMPSEPQEYWGKKYYEEHIRVDNIVINELTDKDFDIKIPAGTVLLREHSSYRIPGDRTMLLSELGKSAKKNVSREPPRVSWFLVLNVGAFILLVLAFIVRHRWQKRKS